MDKQDEKIIADNEQEKQHIKVGKLGAIAIAPNILAKTDIGLWAVESTSETDFRMYVDDTMYKLLGLEGQLTPEETYHAWYDNITDNSYGIVMDAISKMIAGEHAEVQYPWKHPNGKIAIVRCGGVRNFEYKQGIRIEGTHQDVTKVSHYDEDEIKKAKALEFGRLQMMIRNDALKFLRDPNPSIDEFVDYFGKKILFYSKCDQVIYDGIDDKHIVINAPGITSISQDICAKCPFIRFEKDDFADDRIMVINNCSGGYHGAKQPDECPIKSSMKQKVFVGNKVVGLLSVNYINDFHEFTPEGIENIKMIGTFLGFLIEKDGSKIIEKEKLKAEAANKAKTEFLFNMSHDIRTPLNAIIGFTNMAQKYIDNKEKALDCLEKTQQSSNLLLSLINSILDMSRIESGHSTVEENVEDIYNSFRNIEATMKELAKKKYITLTFEYRNITDRYVFCDMNFSVRVFVNIITNAIKYTNEGGFVSVVCEQCGRNKDGLALFRYSFMDNGIGMSEEFQAHMFEQFTREKKKTTASTIGTGLGLAVCKTFVEFLGGTIECHSILNEGTTFTVSLPYKIYQGDEASINQSSSLNRPKTNIPYSFQNKNVLLVEDNALNREIVFDMLDGEGMNVDQAVDGKKAVEIMKVKGPKYYDYILMDIQMPIMNGYEATKAIREMYPTANIPIIALSANAFAEDKKASLAAGMDDHIAKPIDMNELFKSLAKFI